MAKKRQKSWWIPWVFVGAFAVIISVNGIMVTFALTTWTGLETKNHFEAGNNYNATLAAVERQEELGWRHQTRFVPTEPGGLDGKLEVVFTDHDGAPITDALMKVRVMRPTAEDFDQDLAMAHGGEGTYFAVVQLHGKGQWQTRLRAKRGDEPYQAQDVLVVN